MAEKYYIDAAIWRDFHENRVDNLRPLGEWAFELFKLIIETKSKALYSEFVIEELSRDFNKEEINEMFKIIADEGFLEKVEITREQIKEASKLKRELKEFQVPFGDCLHAVVARDNNAIMVTRDHHFDHLQEIADIKKPEDLI